MTARYAIQIAGVGDASSAVLWVTDTLPNTPERQLPHLVTIPDILGASISPEGVAKTVGDLSATIADVGGTAVQWLSIGGRASWYLAGGYTVSATSIDVTDAAGLSINTMVWIGGEALLITGISTNTLTVTRAQLGTTAAAALDGWGVFAANPYLHGRKMWLYRAELGQSFADAQLLGTGVIDVIESTEPGIVSVQASSGSRWAKALVPTDPSAYRVTNYSDGVINFERVSGPASDYVHPEPPRWLYYTLKDELITASAAKHGRPAEHISGPAPMAGDVLYATAAVTPWDSSVATSSDTYTHPLDVVVALLTSYVDVNYTAVAVGQIPFGLGIGLATTDIDLVSLEAVKLATPGHRVGMWWVDSKPQPLANVIAPLLAMCRCWIAEVDGQLTFRRLAKTAIEPQDIQWQDVLEAPKVRYLDQTSGKSVTLNTTDQVYSAVLQPTVYPRDPSLLTTRTQSPVNWLGPGGLASGGYETALSQLFALAAGTVTVNAFLSNRWTGLLPGDQVSLQLPGLLQLQAASVYTVLSVDPEPEGVAVNLVSSGIEAPIAKLAAGGSMASASGSVVTMTDDQHGFEVGDTLIGMTRKLYLGTATQVVTAVSGVTVTLDGDYTGTLVAAAADNQFLVRTTPQTELGVGLVYGDNE